MVQVKLKLYGTMIRIGFGGNNNIVCHASVTKKVLLYSFFHMARPELIVHSNLPIIQILCSHRSSLLFK